MYAYYHTYLELYNWQDHQLQHPPGIRVLRGFEDLEDRDNAHHQNMQHMLGAQYPSV
jgi:hypothetical protein